MGVWVPSLAPEQFGNPFHWNSAIIVGTCVMATTHREMRVLIAWQTCSTIMLMLPNPELVFNWQISKMMWSHNTMLFPLDWKLWSIHEHTMAILAMTSLAPWDHSGLSLTLLVSHLSHVKVLTSFHQVSRGSSTAPNQHFSYGRYRITSSSTGSIFSARKERWVGVVNTKCVKVADRSSDMQLGGS